MDKLKNKIFWVILFILTIFLLSVLCIFNYQDYKHEKTEIQNNLMKMEDNKDAQFKPEKPSGEQEPIEQPVFMDVIAYTVIYNDNNEVIDIINHTQDISSDEIKTIAKEILESDKKETMKIGNLYFDDYSYCFKGHNSLTIIYNKMAKNKLLNLLKTSGIIFVILEAVIIFASIKITSWIIKPVIETFNKQKQFIADASHELKTPIAVIMANAEALEKEPTETKWLNNIKTETERMNELISDLLDLAKLENSSQRATYTEENLSKIIEKTALTFESLIYENKLKFNYDIESDITLKCNGTQIKQLVAILLDNAIEYANENGEIGLQLEKQKNDVILKVSNTGKEIPKEIQEKIFERFYRADEARTRSKNKYGLGLAIAKNIVTNHNGKITVQSTSEKTTFIVSIKQV